MGVSNGDEDGGGVDGDGFGGNSSPRQGAGIEISVPQNLSSMAAELWTFSWMKTNSIRVFPRNGINRRKGNVGGWPRAPHLV